MEPKRKLAITKIISENKNIYIYDATTNLVFPDLDGFSEIVRNYFTKSKEQLLRNLSKKYVKENILLNYNYIDELIKKYNAFYFKTDFKENAVIQSKDELNNKLVNLNQIILEVSQSCNLRCKYCIYSGGYKGYRAHSNKLMKSEIAFKSIDRLLSFVKSDKRTLKYGKVFVNFYGGEPFINFDLIKKVVSYVRDQFVNQQIKEEVYFSISSNGTLLNEEIIHFLVENDIMLAISMDGPKEEHDKNRLKINGEGSFDDLWRNLSRLVELFPDYYKKHVIFLQTLNPNHDLIKIKEFFNNPLIDRYSRIKTSFMRDGETKHQIKRKVEYLQMKKKYYCNKSNSVNHYLDSLSQTFFDKMTSKEFLGRRSQFTGACQPDNFRLYVTVDGSYHLCERINSNYSIGNYLLGIQYKKMKKNYDDLNNFVVKDRCCWCKAKNFCSLCIASLTNGKKFEIDEPCKVQQKIMNGILKDVIYINENNPKYFNRFINKPNESFNDVLI